nr:site-2 protease family protein [Desulfobacterales bacterium]
MDTIVRISVTLIALLFAITIHEVAHGWTANRLGDPTARLAGRLTLNPIKHLDVIGSFVLPLLLFIIGSSIIFGYAKPVPVNFYNLHHYRRDIAVVAAAGPIANLVCALLCGLLSRILLSIDYLWIDSFLFGPLMGMLALLRYSVVINVILAVFNMLPILPLDGGRILSGILPPGQAASLARAERFGIIIVFFLLFTHTIDRIMLPIIRILIGLFMGKIL